MKKLFMILPLVFLLCFAFSCQQREEVGEEQEKVDMKKLADAIVKTYESGNATAIANLYTEDALFIMPGAEFRGRKALLESMESTQLAFPDFEIDILTVLPSGNHIVFEQVVRFSHTGSYLTQEEEIPPTGKKVEYKGVWIGRISPEGLIEEDRYYFDTTVLRQLGLMK